MMTLLLQGGPLDGKELKANRYMPEYALPYPWNRIEKPETIEYYRQHPVEKKLYEHVGSRPYHLCEDKINGSS